MSGITNSASGAVHNVIMQQSLTPSGFTQVGRKTNATDILIDSKIGKSKNSVNSEAAQKLQANVMMKKV